MAQHGEIQRKIYFTMSFIYTKSTAYKMLNISQGYIQIKPTTHILEQMPEDKHKTNKENKEGNLQ